MLYQEFCSYSFKKSRTTSIHLIEGTASIVKMNFSIWYQVNNDEKLIESKQRDIIAKSAYYTWITRCLREILLMNNIE